MKPLEDKRGPYAKLFSASDISTLFSNIAMIEVISKDLLRLFEQAAGEAPRPADVAVGKAMIAKKIALTASFSAYCANQSKALALFDSMKKKASFNAYLQSIRDHPSLRGLGLLDWLIKPVQRVTKYPLLLRELEKNTPENHSDRENTVLAARAVQELVDQVNIAAKNTESLHHILRIADEVGDIPSSLQLKTTPGRYYVTEGKFVKVSHGKHQERFFWMFSDLLMYGRPNVTPMRKYTYKGTIILSKSNYEDLPDGNEFGANAIRITRLDSKKTYIIYCKDPKQKAFWLTNINELKDLGSKGTLTPQMPTIGVAKIVSDSPSSPGTTDDFTTKVAASAETAKSNNSLVMWSVAVRIAGWTNDDQTRTLIHECAAKSKPFGKDVDYTFLFSDGWMGTKIKMFKTAQSSKNAVDFKVFVPFELMKSFTPRSETSVEVTYVDPDGKSRDGSFVIEYESSNIQREILKLLPADRIGKVCESLYTKRISHQADTDAAGHGLVRSQTSASLSFSTSSLPSHTSTIVPSTRTPGPPIPASYQQGTNGASDFSSATFGGPSTAASSPPNNLSPLSSSSSAPLSQPINSQGRNSYMTIRNSTMTAGSPANRALPTLPTLSSSAPNQSLPANAQNKTPKAPPKTPNTPGSRNSSPKPTAHIHRNGVSSQSPGAANPSYANNVAGTPPTGQTSPRSNVQTSTPPIPASHPSTHATNSPSAKFTAATSNGSTSTGYSANSTSSTSFASPTKAPINKPISSISPGLKGPTTGSPSSLPAKTVSSHHSPGPSPGPSKMTAPKPTTPKLSTSSPGPSSPLHNATKSTSAPPMPSVPKYAPTTNTTSPPPKGPGKLSVATKKWPPS